MLRLLQRGSWLGKRVDLILIVQVRRRIVTEKNTDFFKYRTEFLTAETWKTC